MGRDPTRAFRPRLRSAKPPRIGLRVPSSPPTHHRSPPAASDELLVQSVMQMTKRHMVTNLLCYQNSYANNTPEVDNFESNI
uniref:Uncharacterized protein n=1 Tax=Oryza punctata TaxID=4537 RepID=A0A0E0JMV4_ORYPU